MPYIDNMHTDTSSGMHPRMHILEEIETSHFTIQGFPFSVARQWAADILSRYAGLCHRISMEKPRIPFDSILERQWAETYVSFMEWKFWTFFKWLENNDLIRKRMLYLLHLHPDDHASCDRYGAWKCDVFSTSLARVQKLLSNKKHNARGPSSSNAPHSSENLKICLNVLWDCIQDPQIVAHHQSGWHTSVVQICQELGTFPPGCLIKSNEIIEEEDVANFSGGSSTVYRGRYEGKEVAIKKLRVNQKNLESIRKKFIQEFIIHHLLRKLPNIVPFVGVVYEPRRGGLWIITEWMKGGNIIEYLRQHPEAQKKDLLEKIADALHFLQQYNVIHGDLKGDNVLVNSTGATCIVDFGISSFFDDPIPRLSNSELRDAYAFFINSGRSKSESKQLTRAMTTVYSSKSSPNSVAGTLRFMAPERLSPETFRFSSAKPTSESDVYSFGMLMVQVHSGKLPFADASDTLAILHIVNGKSPSRPSTMSDELWKLTEECLNLSPWCRPGIGSVYNRLAVMEDAM